MLQHQVSIIFKFTEDSPIARCRMKAVCEWQAEHKAGTSHPWGSCSHYTAASLLKELTKIEEPPKNFCSADNKYFKKVVLELGPDLHESLVHMVSYCSALLSAKKEHVILDFRPVLNTVLARQSEFISSLLEKASGLGSEPLVPWFAKHVENHLIARTTGIPKFLRGLGPISVKVSAAWPTCTAF